MTNYANYHAYRKFNWNKYRFGWIADALVRDPNDPNDKIAKMITRKGYRYVMSDWGYGDGAIAKGKHKMLEPIRPLERYIGSRLFRKVYAILFEWI